MVQAVRDRNGRDPRSRPGVSAPLTARRVFLHLSCARVAGEASAGTRAASNPAPLKPSRVRDPEAGQACRAVAAQSREKHALFGRSASSTAFVCGMRVPVGLNGSRNATGRLRRPGPRSQEGTRQRAATPMPRFPPFIYASKTIRLSRLALAHRLTPLPSSPCSANTRGVGGSSAPQPRATPFRIMWGRQFFAEQLLYMLQ